MNDESEVSISGSIEAIVVIAAIVGFLLLILGALFYNYKTHEQDLRAFQDCVHAGQAPDACRKAIE